MAQRGGIAGALRLFAMADRTERGRLKKIHAQMDVWGWRGQISFSDQDSQLKCVRAAAATVPLR